MELTRYLLLAEAAAASPSTSALDTLLQYKAIGAIAVLLILSEVWRRNREDKQNALLAEEARKRNAAQAEEQVQRNLAQDARIERLILAMHELNTGNAKAMNDLARSNSRALNRVTRMTLIELLSRPDLPPQARRETEDVQRELADEGDI